MYGGVNLLDMEVNVREYRSGNQYSTHKRGKKQKHNTISVGHNYNKQKQITEIRHAPSHKQLEVKRNRTSFYADIATRDMTNLYGGVTI